MGADVVAGQAQIKATGSFTPPAAKWIVWYADGSRYDSESVPWKDLPQLGVVYMLLLYPDGTKRHMNGSDLYYITPDGVMANDNDKDAVLRLLPWVKFGQWVTDESFRSVSRQALEVAEQWHKDKYRSGDHD